MYSEVYKEWIALFNDDFIQIWENERKELQRVSLLSYAFQKELKNLRNNVEVEMINLKQLLKYKDDLEKKTKSLSPQIRKTKSPNTVDKENNFENHVGLKQATLRKNQTDNESPDLFKDIDLNAHCSTTDLSVIDLSISEDDVINIEGSPTIKKRRKRYKVIPNPPAFSIITECQEKPVTPVETIRNSVKTNLFKTPVVKSHLDFSVIEGTPEIITNKSKTSSRVSDFLSKKKFKNRKSNNSTLTQMFKNSSRRTQNEKPDDGADSDETFYEDSTSVSKMGITDLLDYINKSDSNKQEIDKRGNEGETSWQDIDTSSQEIDKFSKGAIFDEKDVQTSSEKPKVIPVEPEPVVRGNARKQLHGWSCHQCKDFYSQMKLPPEEMQKKMDECSRHRYKYRPPEETIPGFWDLSIPPEN
ncbi:uncharacterized protein LOC108908708 isoform X1 [Anoplophora glabripennis]|uniref:uncharacterized protein LOC108908708 isoform X1 n=1 Tax=Anoplophora glabripennis TaxID=217634 RepID=UPI0008746B0B|nr:uncharacterized protein LOC108908708 isoform X1 [Anoplophora glabripennis]